MASLSWTTTPNAPGGVLLDDKAGVLGARDLRLAAGSAVFVKSRFCRYCTNRLAIDARRLALTTDGGLAAFRV
jgi:hypothetical protein